MTGEFKFSFLLLPATQNLLNSFCILRLLRVAKDTVLLKTFEAKLLTCHSCRQRLPDIHVPLSRGHSLSFPALEI